MLASEVSRLASKVQELEKRLVELETRALLRPQQPVITAAGTGSADQGKVGDDLWSWLGQASLLPRLAAVSFVLVLALVLRTLTDNQVLAPRAGSLIGLAYAGLLLLAGWRLLARKSRIGVLFPLCGALLMFLVILETHARFHAFSSPVAYGLLLATLAAMLALGRGYRLPLLSQVGIIGSGASGFAIDFPEPFFPLLAGFLAIVNLAAYLEANLPPRRELARWSLFLITALFWLQWPVKIHTALSRGQSLSAHLGIHWFLPFLGLYLAGGFAMTAHRAFRLARLTRLDCLLPTALSLLLYLAAWAVVIPWRGLTTWVGLAGLAWAGLLFLAATLAAQQSQESSKAACVFTFAGAALLLVAVPDATRNLLLALPVWSVVALLLIRLSGHCEVGGIRFASYLLQLAACVAGVASGNFSVTAPALAPSLAVAALLAVLSGIHYGWSRQHPITCSAGFFARIDPGDRTAFLLLLTTVVNAFAALQLAAALLLAGTADFHNLLTGLHSVFINGGAFLLMVLGLRHQNREILAAALAVFIVGAGKVFAYDLFEARGVPLVLSVFSFGAAAAFGSIVLSRWQQKHRDRPA